MTRKILSAFAALFVFASIVLALPQPAAAAPGGACSIEEWSNPANFTDCARRTREAAATAAGCATAPSPGSPASGMAGWFTTEPDSAKRDGVQGQYSLYGTGGYGLDTYDMGCLGNLKHPDLVGWNTMASGEFMFAAAALGATNKLREIAYDPGSMWGWSDPMLAQATDAVYKHVFTVFGALTLAALGLFLMWSARHGNLSGAMKTAAWALFVVVLATGVARWPVNSVHAADSVASGGLNAVHAVLGPGPQDIPAAECALGGEACIDHRTVAVRSSDVATKAILYRMWLRAALGDSDSETAQKYGPALFSATTLTWGEAERAAQSPGLRQQLIQQKADLFNTLAKQISEEDPLAYEHLQGVHGSDRFGAGLIALIQSLVFSFFDSLASLLILFGFAIFRVAVVLLPLLATVGLFEPASAGLRRVINAVVAGVFQIVLFGAASGAYLLIVDGVFRTPMPGIVQTAVIGLVGVVLAILMHPLRQVTSTITGRSRGKDGFLVRAMHGGKKLLADQQAAAATASDSAPATTSVPARPEAAPPTSHRGQIAGTVISVVAPSVGEAGSHPLVGAVRTAATARPENGSSTASTSPSKFKRVASTVMTVAATAAGGPAGGTAAAAVTAAANRPETGK